MAFKSILLAVTFSTKFCFDRKPDLELSPIAYHPSPLFPLAFTFPPNSANIEDLILYSLTSIKSSIKFQDQALFTCQREVVLEPMSPWSRTYLGPTPSHIQ
jgi:hypothetical protein